MNHKYIYHPYEVHIQGQGGNYKRKQESKKRRKRELDQESDQEKRKYFLWLKSLLLPTHT